MQRPKVFLCTTFKRFPLPGKSFRALFSYDGDRVVVQKLDTVGLMQLTLYGYGFLFVILLFLHSFITFFIRKLLPQTLLKNHMSHRALYGQKQIWHFLPFRFMLRHSDITRKLMVLICLFGLYGPNDGYRRQRSIQKYQIQHHGTYILFYFQSMEVCSNPLGKMCYKNKQTNESKAVGLDKGYNGFSNVLKILLKYYISIINYYIYKPHNTEFRTLAVVLSIKNGRCVCLFIFRW